MMATKWFAKSGSMNQSSNREDKLKQLSPEDQQELQKMHDTFIDARKNEPERLHDHLEAFHDAILAIVATIIVLEITPPVHEVHYGSFISDLAVFLISFIIIVSFWYDLHSLFSYFVIRPTGITAILELCLLADLSLLPMMTKWIMAEHSGFAAVNYDVIYLIASILKVLIQRSGMPMMSQNLRKILFRHALWQTIFFIALNVTLIVLAFYYPRVIMVLYLSLPIISELFMYFERRTALRLRNSAN